MSDERLQKILSRAGFGSRRHCEDLIANGYVSVNGRIENRLGSKADLSKDTVEVNGQLVCVPDTNVTFKINKPKGMITAMSDAHGARCISELLPTKEFPSLFPIGRLDKDTTGLILATTDGELGNALMHPSSHVDKTYEALIQGKLTHKELSQLEAGILLDDRLTAPAKVRILNSENHRLDLNDRGSLKGDFTLTEITIHEGRNRQVRRMFKAVGHEVVELQRTKYGPILLDGLSQCECVKLTQDELNALMSSCNKR